HAHQLVEVGDEGDLDAAVLAAALGGVVGLHGGELAVAGGGEVAGVHPGVHEELHDLDGAGGGELPVGGEAGGLDLHVVGVAGDLEAAVGHRVQHAGHLG